MEQANILPAGSSCLFSSGRVCSVAEPEAGSVSSSVDDVVVCTVCGSLLVAAPLLYCAAQLYYAEIQSG